MTYYWQALWIALAPWNFWFNIGAAISAILAAFLWLGASQVKMPHDGIVFVHPTYERAILELMTRQNKWNSWAALMSALAAFLTALGVSTTTFWHT
jgi:hypothetical protein